MERRGPYWLLEEVSRGEWGILHKARLESEPDSPAVLLKSLHKTPSQDWLRAVKRLQKSPCPYLRVAKQVLSDEQGSYLVLDWLEGPNLEKMREEQADGRVGVKLALQWLHHCLQALHSLHQQRLLHGDVKPSNLILNSSKEAILTDLGTLQSLGGKLPSAATEAYLIPAEKEHNTVQRDLYAAALTFGALVSGRLCPPPGEVPYRLSALDPLIPEAVDQLITRVQGFGEPFESAESMLNTVEALLGKTRPSPLSPAGTSPPTRLVALPKAKAQLSWAPLLLALLCFPGGLLSAQVFKTPPPGLPYTLEERTGISLRNAEHKDKELWKPTILGRPVAGFCGSDLAEGGESAELRAHWTTAVLAEATFQDRALQFEYRRELEDNCEVWLVGSGGADKFLFRVTVQEKELFDTPAPVLARLWAGLMRDTLTLLGSQSAPGQAQGVLLLRPWRTRAETLAGGRALTPVERVSNLKKAFESLSPQEQEDLLSSYDPQSQDKKP